MVYSTEERRLAELETRLVSRFKAISGLYSELEDFKTRIQQLTIRIKENLGKPGYEFDTYPADAKQLETLQEQRGILLSEIERQDAAVQDFGELVGRCKTYLQDQRRARLEAEGPPPARNPPQSWSNLLMPPR